MIQHPELDGPFSVGVDNNRWNTTSRFYAAHTSVLSPYLVVPAPLTRVWAGDDPINPQNTIALAFPSSGIATTILIACGAINLITEG